MYDATWLLRLYARRRLRQLEAMEPQQAQRRVLSSLISSGRRTKFGRDHEFSTAWTLDDYRSRVPLRDYDAFWEAYWRQPFPRLTDCTWPGLIPWFAVSSGTTTGATKYIPVSREMHRSNVRASAEMVTHHLANRPESRLFAGRVFMLGGSTGLVRQSRGVFSGDLSGIEASAMPGWARLRYFPPRDLESIADWQIKIDRFAERSLDEEITAVVGTPSWLLIFFERLAEIAGARRGGAASRIADIYPALELLSHGGVAWAPYRDRFAALLDGSRAETREVYPASEGFFAVADRGDGEGLRLLLDTGIFYEFIPVDQLGSAQPDCRWVGDVEPGVNYALAVTTCAGLWRYLVGDTVTVVERDPPRVLVTGRTSYMLSAFGEHVIGAEVERAVAEAARDRRDGLRFCRRKPVSGGNRRARRAPLHRRAWAGVRCQRPRRRAPRAFRRRTRRDALPPQRRLCRPPRGRLRHGCRACALSPRWRLRGLDEEPRQARRPEQGAPHRQRPGTLRRIAPVCRCSRRDERRGHEAMKGHGTMTRLLMIEDDRALAEMVATYLSRAGMTLDHRESAEAGLAAALQGGYDAVVLDLMLPDGDGLALCRAIRARSDVPILMLTARGEEADRIVGLEIGADDYLPKPFNPRELLARLRAILRRRGREVGNSRAAAGELMRFGRLTIDRAARRILVDGEERSLTGHQFDLLCALAESAGRVLSREQLMDRVRGEALEAFDRSIDVHISRIRAAIEDDPKNPRRIVTLRGAGYLFTRSQDEDA